MILGLSGYAGSGKDAIADRLVTRWGWRRAAFADPIRRILERVDPVLRVGMYYEEIETDTLGDLLRDGWDYAKKNPKVRRLMQALGDACREELGADVFMHPVFRRIADEPWANWIITDVRKFNEAQSLRHGWWAEDVDATRPGYGFATLVRVIRPGVGPVNDHSSETELDGYDFDGEFLNAGTLEDLHRWVDNRVESGVWG